jgi:hypothetical protein
MHEAGHIGRAADFDTVQILPFFFASLEAPGNDRDVGGAAEIFCYFFVYYFSPADVWIIVVA